MYRVSNLDARYKTARSNVYVRLKKLGITPERVGRNACITDDQLAVMDRLDQFIREGGTIPDFINQEGIHPQSQVKETVLDCFRYLEEACYKGWLLGTSQLAMLLNVAPRLIDESTGQFTDGGFLFRHEGKRLSGEAAWRVSKPEQKI